MRELHRSDWRLQGQERTLKGVELCQRSYRPYPKNPNWGHDHCSFCWVEFAVEDRPDVLHEGYCTLDEYYWICSDCFGDFKERFEWRVVAWTAQMSNARGLPHLHGRELESVHQDDETEQWIFLFASGLSLQVSSAWRLVTDGRVAVGWRDDGQWFGLSEPVDTKARVRAIVGSSSVVSTDISALGDLVVRFTGGPCLELFNESSGYEGWQLYGPGLRRVVAQGGGNVYESAT